jgi:hypothetical protein
MNIFFLDKDPVIAAQSQFDIHVNKMMIESAQLLSTAHHVLQSDINNKLIYKATHKNHPMSKWVYEYVGNYEWLLAHAQALADEFKYRRKKDHKTMETIVNLHYDISKFYPSCDKELLMWGNHTVTTPPLCMFDQYKKECVIESYREFYKNAKLKDSRGIPMNIFTRRKPPEWLLDGQVI